MKIVYWRKFQTDGVFAWYWHLQTKNGHIIADSAEGYASRRNVLRAVNRFSSFLSVDVPVVELN